MKIRSFASVITLVGALATSNLAFADGQRHEWTRSIERTDEARVIGTARLTKGRGTAIFQITPKMVRDGLQLATNAHGLKIRSIQFEYSDGRIERIRAPQLGTGNGDGSLLTIQTGRPPGLRVVRVRYQMSGRARSATLRLIQVQDGDGVSDT